MFNDLRLDCLCGGGEKHELSVASVLFWRDHNYSDGGGWRRSPCGRGCVSRVCVCAFGFVCVGVGVRAIVCLFLF